LDTPNFIIIGAPKSGTTALYHYLRQHPDVFMSAVKEPRYFAYLADTERGLSTNSSFFVVRTAEAYQQLFAGATAKAVGEASVAYLDTPDTARLLGRVLPHAKLIALLRNPVERAYSHFLMDVRDGLETRSLDDAIAEGSFLRAGFYFKNLSDYHRHFPEEAFGIYLHEDLRDRPAELMQTIYRFLDIDDTFMADLTTMHNVGGAPRSRLFNAALSKTRVRLWSMVKNKAPSWVTRMADAIRRLNHAPAPMPVSARRTLVQIYKPDILALEKLIGRDLSHWLVVQETPPDSD
jgi:Sulfotransferase family